MVFLASSILIIIGIALLFLAGHTYLDSIGSCASCISYLDIIEVRNRAYIEMVIGLIFLAAGAIVFWTLGTDLTESAHTICSYH